MNIIDVTDIERDEPNMWKKLLTERIVYNFCGKSDDQS